jgi:hypothetical protein
MIGCGAIVRFGTAPSDVEGVPVDSLVDFDVKLYDANQECPECKHGVPAETVRF